MVAMKPIKKAYGIVNLKMQKKELKIETKHPLSSLLLIKFLYPLALSYFIMFVNGYHSLVLILSHVECVEGIVAFLNKDIKPLNFKLLLLCLNS